jgi:hypothetical protein
MRRLAATEKILPKTTADGGGPVVFYATARIWNANPGKLYFGVVTADFMVLG